MAAIFEAILLQQKLFQFWQVEVWSKTCRNRRKTKQEIKFKKFTISFRMFYPFVTSRSLYCLPCRNNNSCLKFEIY